MTEKRKWTLRQKQIRKLRRAGWSDDQIAYALGIQADSVRTAMAYRSTGKPMGRPCKVRVKP